MSSPPRCRADFYPRPPRGGRRSSRDFLYSSMSISIHALREEGDAARASFPFGRENFYPRPPRGGRPDEAGHSSASGIISIHALREEGDRPRLAKTARRGVISIHALREEGDRATEVTHNTDKNFYPRPPRGGRRQGLQLVKKAGGFLSTPSARRATLGLPRSPTTPTKFLSTPSARRATQLKKRQTIREKKFLSTPSARRATCLIWRYHDAQGISIHALREEGDEQRIRDYQAELISIHALREEGDTPKNIGSGRPSDFYPRPPRGGRLSCLIQPSLTLRFLSTPSARRATIKTRVRMISKEDFYPRPPRGGRRLFEVIGCILREISIHALREEGDSKNRDKISIFL